MGFPTLTSSPYGFIIESQTGYVTNRTGGTLAIGEVVMTDLTDADAGTDGTVLTVGSSSSILANALVPTTAGIGTLSGASPAHPGYFFGVVIDLADGAGADDTVVRVAWKGLVPVKCVATAIVVGVPLIAANAVKTLAPAPAAGNKIIGIAYQANGSAAGTYLVMFDGIHGWGRMEAS